MKKPPIKITLFLTSLFSIGLFWFMANQTDTFSYTNAINLLAGLEGEPDRLFRQSKFIGLLFPVLLTKLGLPAIYSLFTQQILMWGICGILYYKILLHLWKKPYHAYIGMLMLILCQPMAVYGLAFLNDSIGWAMLLGGVYYSIKNGTHFSNWESLLLGTYFGLGFFVKETILLAGLFTFFIILLQKSNAKEKMQQLLYIGTPCIAILALGSLLTWLLWDQTLYHWIIFNQDTPPPSSLKSIITQSYRTIDVFWFLIPLGVYQLLAREKANNQLRSFFLTATTAWLILPFAWNYHYDRIFFMAALFILPFGALTLITYFPKTKHFLALAGGLSNLTVTYCIYRYQINGLILIAAIGYIILIICAYLFEKNNNKQARAAL